MPNPPETGVNQFFSAPTESSKIKARIVADYFPVWANIIAPSTLNWGGTKVAYIDLYAGQGRYKDGTKSTPLLVLERAIADERLREMLVVMLNDGAEEHSNSLKNNIESLEGYDRLKHKPKIYTSEVDESIVKMFEETPLVPSLIFVDPWGYKGLTLPLLKSLIKDWGSDCIFFFNYRRINMAVNNPAVRKHMEAIFGPDRLVVLEKKLSTLKRRQLPKATSEQETERRRRIGQRRRLIMNALSRALKELVGKYVVRFRFRNRHGYITHYLVFVTKHFRGYERMRAIMAKYSTTCPEGVPSLEYNLKEIENPSFDFGVHQPIDKLKEQLVQDLAGQTLNVWQIFETHSVGKRYLLENYKEALRRLEAEKRVRAYPAAEKRPKRKGIVTMADKTIIAFPPV